jgi:murein DD-endopeptidase MepM/ murein hydrolase activator NlpD
MPRRENSRAEGPPAPAQRALLDRGRRVRDRRGTLAALLLLVASAAQAAPPNRGGEVRRHVREALAEQAQVVESTRRVVADKLVEASGVRRARARAVYQLLRGQRSDGRPEARIVVARQRAIARYLLLRDQREADLLSVEASKLALAAAALRDEGRAADGLGEDAPSMDWPVQGLLARGFGLFRHETSGATLSRRGVDLEVPAGSPVVAPAPGVIRYVGPIRGLDHGVIIDHAGMYSVIAKLRPSSVIVGSQIARGAIIGQPARQRVYIEVRVAVGIGGTPVDPRWVFSPGQDRF